MFEASLFESEGRIRAKNGRGIAIAATVQAIAFGTLLLTPLFYPARLPQRALLMTLTAPPPPIPALKPPATLTATTASALQMVAHALATPSIISHIRADASSVTPDVPTAPGTAINTGVDVGTLLNKLGSGTSNAIHPASAAPRGPVRISSGVMQGQLDSPILPVYPSIARAARIHGTVIVAATVSRTGAIEKLQVISGPMIFRQAALDAIQHAHYRPFKLNGESVEVDTTISIIFAVGDGH